MRKICKTSLMALLVLNVGVAGLASAQDVPQRKEVRRADLSGAPGMEVVESIAEFKPGETLAAHSHHGIEALYVIQGATLQSADGKTHEIPTGVAAMNLRDVVHGGDKVVGDKSFKYFAVHVVDKGKPLYEPAAK